MGYPDSFSTKSDPMIPVVSVGADSRRSVNRTARLGQNGSELGQAVRISDCGVAVHYCISNDLI